eukprot:45837_1
MAWIQSIAASMSQLFVFPIALLTQKYPYPRIFVTAGMILIASGYFASGFCKQLWNFYISYGVMCGLGASLVLMPSINVVKLYKFSRFGLIMGIVSGGAGVGSLIIAPINNWMLQEYGWSKALKILGISSAICGIFMVLSLRKPSFEYDFQQTEVKQQILDGSDESINNRREQTDTNSLREAIKYTFQNWNTYCLILSMPILFLGYWTAFVFIEPYCKHVGISNESASFMISSMGIFNVVGKIVTGHLADRFGSKWVFIVCLFLKGILTMSFVWIKDEYALFVIVSFIGLFAGCFALVAKVILDYFDNRYFIVILGLNGAAAAGGSVAGQPIVGWLIGFFDNWHIPGLFA